jgi:hypothetical protein
MTASSSEPHAPPAAVPFSAAEIQEFQQSDRKAGGTVVALMASIFTIGLLLYSFVALTL